MKHVPTSEKQSHTSASEPFMVKHIMLKAVKQLRERKAARDMSGRCLRFRPKICTLDD
jgi:hypothetical protein